MCVLLHAHTHSSGESGGQSHFQVPLHAQHRRDQDEELCDFLEHVPVLPWKHTVQNTPQRLNHTQHHKTHSEIIFILKVTPPLKFKLVLAGLIFFFNFPSFSSNWSLHSRTRAYFTSVFPLHLFQLFIPHLERQEMTTKPLLFVVFLAFPHLNHIKQHPCRDRPEPGQQKRNQDLKHHGADRLSGCTGTICMLCSPGSTDPWGSVKFTREQKVCLSVLLRLIVDTGVDWWNILIGAWTFRASRGLRWGRDGSALLAGASACKAAWGQLAVLWLGDNHGVNLGFGRMLFLLLLRLPGSSGTYTADGLKRRRATSIIICSEKHSQFFTSRQNWVVVISCTW